MTDDRKAGSDTNQWANTQTEYTEAQTKRQDEILTETGGRTNRAYRLTNKRMHAYRVEDRQTNKHARWQTNKQTDRPSDKIVDCTDTDKGRYR